MKLSNLFNKNSSSEEALFSPRQDPPFSPKKKRGINKLPVDVYEEGDKIIIRALAVGAQEEDIDIFLKEDIITISGKTTFAPPNKKEKYFCQECPWGEFSRSIVLPYLVRPQSFQKQLKNGILTITLKKLL